MVDVVIQFGTAKLKGFKILLASLNAIPSLKDSIIEATMQDALITWVVTADWSMMDKYIIYDGYIFSLYGYFPYTTSGIKSLMKEIKHQKTLANSELKSISELMKEYV